MAPTSTATTRCPSNATATQSRHLSNLAVERSRARQAAASDEAILDIVRLVHDAGGRRIVYPAGRYLGTSLGAFIVGAVFAAVGWWIIASEGQTFFGSVFGGIGALIALVALYMASNSLEVSQDGMHIRTVRRIVGIPVKRSFMRRDAFVKFSRDSSFQTQSGGKHVIYYSIYAHDIEGDKIVVGEGFKGESEARAAQRLIGKELGLASREKATGEQTPAESWDPAGLLS